MNTKNKTSHSSHLLQNIFSIKINCLLCIGCANFNCSLSLHPFRSVTLAINVCYNFRLKSNMKRNRMKRIKKQKEKKKRKNKSTSTIEHCPLNTSVLDATVVVRCVGVRLALFVVIKKNETSDCSWNVKLCNIVVFVQCSAKIQQTDRFAYPIDCLHTNGNKHTIQSCFQRYLFAHLVATQCTWFIKMLMVIYFLLQFLLIISR